MNCDEIKKTAAEMVVFIARKEAALKAIDLSDMQKHIKYRSL